jgi:hypothetical protein
MSRDSIENPSFVVGAIDGVLYHIFSYIDDNFDKIILANKQPTPQLSVAFAFRSNLYEHYKKVLLSLKFCKKLCNVAALEGNLAGLQWSRNHGYFWDSLTCANAAQGGHLEVLQWARTNGWSWDGRVCANAARGDHLEVLQWARMNGCEWDACTCACAADSGHLRVLQWARENGCPWDSRTTEYAAEGGHLGVLQWARENGCEWSSDVCSCAAKGGHLEVLQWARANGYRPCPYYQRARETTVYVWGQTSNGRKCRYSAPVN